MTSHREKVRDQAVQIHSRDAAWFEAQYHAPSGQANYPFLYGRRQVDEKLEAAVRRVPKGGKALDVGCGTGDLVLKLRDAGYDAHGIEPSEAMREYAVRKLGPEFVREGTILSLPYPDASFDLVTAIEVLRYLTLEDNVQALTEIHRVLKPGGIFFGTFVNLYAADGFAGLIWLRRAWAGIRRRELDHHTEFETPQGLSEKLRHAGFLGVRVEGAMFAPIRIAYKVSPTLARGLGGLTERFEGALCKPPFHRFAGHLIASATA